MAKLDLENKKEMLIARFTSNGTLKSEQVIRAFRKVPREEFIPPSQIKLAYNDTPLTIGKGQTISAPHMCIIMCELLDLQIGEKVLEIGAGSGYHAALCAEIVAPLESENPGHVYTIERIPELVELAKANLEKAGYSERVTVILGDGTEGYKEKAPYDKILVTAAGPKIPQPIKNQLAIGGRLVVPVGKLHFYQNLMIVDRVSEKKFKKQNYGGVAFVPLIGKYGYSPK